MKLFIYSSARELAKSTFEFLQMDKIISEIVDNRAFMVLAAPQFTQFREEYAVKGLLSTKWTPLKEVHTYIRVLLELRYAMYRFFN